MIEEPTRVGFFSAANDTINIKLSFEMPNKRYFLMSLISLNTKQILRSQEKVVTL